MKKLPRRILILLREPAVQTAIAIVALLVVIWGSIKGWFEGFVAWLGLRQEWPNWALLLLGVILVYLAASRVATALRNRRAQQVVDSGGMTYHLIWNALWGWPPFGSNYVGDGPLCPKHKLPLDVKTLDGYLEGDRYDFVCAGLEGEEGHTIIGPKFDQLVGSEGCRRRDPNIYSDVNARLKAKYLREA